jgi:hypothetical protein
MQETRALISIHSTNMSALTMFFLFILLCLLTLFWAFVEHHNLIYILCY